MLIMSAMLVSCGESPPDPAREFNSEPEPMEDDRPVILFVGDSLTAGFQLDPSVAYPELIQQKLDAAGLSARVVNAGVSGDTSADGRSRIQWLLRQPVDTLVLALGANDALRGQPTANLQANLSAILEATRERNPDVLLVVAGIRMPTNYGPEYTAALDQVFLNVAQEFGALLIPFLLEGVGGQAHLNLADGIHPNAAGHEIIAALVWDHLKGPLVTRYSNPG